ncbi:MAG TPA: triose-phosphate isomerase [Candidatus Eisenbacteria bacterium]|nr:triose-phosphate isomerase [Candidatus Eisenbacteria bacterium]
MNASRPPVVAGNWKMNKTNPEAVSLVRELIAELGASPPCEIVLCPPFTALTEVSLLLGGTAIRLGAQNLHAEAKGAFTGEVSGDMVRSTGCTHVLVGHSERRRLFGESDDMVAKKTRAALASGLSPIVCLGETLEERERNETAAVVTRQLEVAVLGLPPDAVPRLLLAYEPVWAIGTGRTATPAQAQEVHALLRARLGERFGESGRRVRILYGGSCTADSAGDLLSQEDVDGTLVGGASLEAKGFARIARAAGAAR